MEVAGFGFEALLHHEVDTAVDAVAEVGHGDHTHLDVEGSRGGFLVGDDLRVRLPCHVAHFEGALEADGIAEVNAGVVVRVEELELGAFLLEGHLLQACAEFGRGVGHGGDAEAQGVDVEAAAADGEDNVVVYKETVEEVEGVVLVVGDVVRLGHRTAGDEMMGYSG